MINETVLNDTWKGFLDMYVLAQFYNEIPTPENAEKLLWVLRVTKKNLLDIEKSVEESHD